MRTELIPLLGQPVVAFGHLTSMKHRRRLLKKVYLYKWDLNKTQQNQPSEWYFKGQPHRGKPIVIDHLWEYMPDYYKGYSDDHHESLYEKTYTQGHVAEYTRANGTTDLGIETAVTVFADQHEKIKMLKGWNRWKEIHDLCVDILKTDSWIFAVTKKQTPRELKRWVINLQSEAEQKLSRR